MASSRDDVRYVVVDFLIDTDRLSDVVDHLDEIFGFSFFWNVVLGYIPCTTTPYEEYPLLICRMRIAEDDPHEESVELSLREWICTLMLQGILCREYDKWRRQIESSIPDGDSFFFHGLEEGRLYLGWSTIDLIGEENIGEYRSLPDLELALLGSVDLIAREIRWEEIRGE